MNSYSVMIVDDSPFTVAIIRDILERHGHQVVGVAETLDEVNEVVRATMPDLVTMDITLPGTDGLECTRAIHQFNPMITVIAISSMKDDDIVSEAIRHNISAYIQKPLDEDEFIDTINKAMSTDDLFEVVDAEYFGVIKEAFQKGIHSMTKTNPAFKEEFECDETILSEGVTSVINIIGKYPGRMLFSLSKATAAGLAVSILKREPREGEINNLLMELTNIVSGHAVSRLNATINKRNRSYNLRLSPPSIFVGQDMQVFPPGFKTQSALIETVFGDIILNAGFKKGE
ncbi:MAG: response regulator [Defluviitaleaceae bacterium]|nr:response regulator [Defluviitaleaceae bacterium]MCL2240708.1 response regulator [Defluviitaleaceae bacterium]